MQFGTVYVRKKGGRIKPLKNVPFSDFHIKKGKTMNRKEIILEGMTSISALLNTDAKINDRAIFRVLIDRQKTAKKAPEIRFLEAQESLRGFAIQFTDADEIDALASGKTHGGILAVCGDRTLPALTSEQILPGGFYVYLEGMEDPYNFGNTLRSLYAAGVDGIVVPERNWMSAAGIVARSSAGASERLPILTADARQTEVLFHQAGYQILCAGIRDSVSIFEESFHYPILLVIGGEKRGISRELLEAADQTIRIDYGRNFRGSLSSSASAAVLAFELFRQNRH